RQGSFRKIPEQWRPAILDVIRAYKIYLGSRLHSIYVLGSVAKGKPKGGISDLDTIAVVNDQEQKADEEWENKFPQDEMKARYPFVANFDVGILSKEEIMATKWHKVLIKLESACVYGPDIAKDLPQLRPGEDTRISIQATRKRVEKALR